MVSKKRSVIKYNNISHKKGTSGKHSKKKHKSLHIEQSGGLIGGTALATAITGLAGGVTGGTPPATVTSTVDISSITQDPGFNTIVASLFSKMRTIDTDMRRARYISGPNNYKFGIDDTFIYCKVTSIREILKLGLKSYNKYNFMIFYPDDHLVLPPYDYNKDEQVDIDNYDEMIKDNKGSEVLSDGSSKNKIENKLIKILVPGSNPKHFEIGRVRLLENAGGVPNRYKRKYTGDIYFIVNE